MKIMLLLTCLYIALPWSFAQYEDYEFGEISREEKALESVPGYPDADAYILFDRLEVEMVVSPVTRELELKQTVSRRIKLFEESSFYRAHVAVNYFQEEEFKRFKASVYYADGGVLELDHSDLTCKGIEAGLYECAFSFPHVEKGSIIEYTYELQADLFSFDRLPVHYFQDDLPCRWSEYVVVKPQDFHYVYLDELPNFDLIERVENPRLSGFFGEIVSIYTHDRYVLKDVPPVEVEPHVNNLQDYMPRIRKHIDFVNWQNIIFNSESYTWEYLAKDIRRKSIWKNINLRARGSRFLRDVEPLLVGVGTDLEKAKVVYRLLNNQMRWDQNYDCLSDASPNRIWDRRVGNSAEINALLLYALRQLGIDARPVLIGLRGYGHPMEDFPDLSQFNHMLVYAELDGEKRLLDVAGHTLPFGYVRPLALNNKGWLLGDDSADWIYIQAPIAKEHVDVEIDWEANGMARVRAQTNSGGYFGLIARDDMLNAGIDTPVRPFVDQISSRYPESVLIEERLPHADNPEQPYFYSFDMELPLGQQVGDELSFRPLLLDYVDNDILADPSRTLPVDFNFGFHRQYMSSILIPNEYEIATLPEDVDFRSDDGSVKLSFHTAIANDRILIDLDIQILRTQYSLEEYEVLWQLFNTLKERQESTITLKKNILERP